MAYVNHFCVLVVMIMGFIVSILVLDGFLTYFMMIFNFDNKPDIQQIMLSMFLIVAIQSCVCIIMMVFFLFGYRQMTKKRRECRQLSTSINNH